MITRLLFSAGFLVTLLSATRRPGITDLERERLMTVCARIDKRLGDLTPQVVALEEGTAPAQDRAHMIATLDQQIQLLDEIEGRLRDCPPSAVSQVATGVTQGDHGGSRARINSQDPGAFPGDMRRTGVIVKKQKYGVRSGNEQIVGVIKLDHPQPHETEHLLVFEGNYENPQPDGREPKMMRRGDWVSFIVTEGSSSHRDANGRLAADRQGRVMASRVRKIGYLSAAERALDDWLPFFTGGLVDADGYSLAPGETEGGTPFWLTPANPWYARSQATRSVAGRSATTWRTGHSGQSGRRQRRPRAPHAPSTISIHENLPYDSDSPDEFQLGQDAEALAQADQGWYWDYQLNRWAQRDANVPQP